MRNVANYMRSLQDLAVHVAKHTTDVEHAGLVARLTTSAIPHMKNMERGNTSAYRKQRAQETRRSAHDANPDSIFTLPVADIVVRINKAYEHYLKRVRNPLGQTRTQFVEVVYFIMTYTHVTISAGRGGELTHLSARDVFGALGLPPNGMPVPGTGEPAFTEDVAVVIDEYKTQGKYGDKVIFLTPAAALLWWLYAVNIRPLLFGASGEGPFFVNTNRVRIDNFGREMRRLTKAIVGIGFTPSQWRSYTATLALEDGDPKTRQTLLADRKHLDTTATRFYERRKATAIGREARRVMDNIIGAATAPAPVALDTVVPPAPPPPQVTDLGRPVAAAAAAAAVPVATAGVAVPASNQAKPAPPPVPGSLLASLLNTATPAVVMATPLTPAQMATVDPACIINLRPYRPVRKRGQPTASIKDMDTDYEPPGKRLKTTNYC